MKYKFKVQIRGNLQYASQTALQAAMAKKLAGIKDLTIISRSVELWQSNGAGHEVEPGLYRFTIALDGNILADSDTEVEAMIAGFCNQYPEFLLTYQSITGWQNGMGGLKEFNDDGTEYFAFAPAQRDEAELEVEVI